MLPIVISTDPRGRNSKILRGLNRVGEEFVRRANPTVQQLMIKFARQARSNVPRRTGALRSSIRYLRFTTDRRAGAAVSISIDRLARRRGQSKASAAISVFATEMGRQLPNGSRTKGVPYFYRIWDALGYPRIIRNKTRVQWRRMIRDIQSGKLALANIR